MPELPEVETTKRGLEVAMLGHRIVGLEIRRRDLRWPIPPEVDGCVGGQVVAVQRRAKYLLIETKQAALLVHLGMSGSLRVEGKDMPCKKHDHVIFRLDNGVQLHFHDPRRFGCILPLRSERARTLLEHLGVEPLSTAFSGEYIFANTRGRKANIKAWLMDQANVVGVGNIYAAESLFLAGVRPSRAAWRVTQIEADLLANAVKDVLRRAIAKGGTTLNDFVHGRGETGYFVQSLHVYGRQGEPCKRCKTPIVAMRGAARQSCYCRVCQK